MLSLNNMYVIWVMFLTGMHLSYLDWQRKILLIGYLMIINVQSPLGTSLNRCRLHCQIAWCNAVINKDKSDCYRKLISDNSHDSRKLWPELHTTLNRVSDVTLLFHESEKWLADQSTSFYQKKLRKLEILSLHMALKMRFTPSFRRPEELSPCIWPQFYIKISRMCGC